MGGIIITALFIAIGVVFVFKTDRVIAFYEWQAESFSGPSRTIFFWWLESPKALRVYLRVIGCFALVTASVAILAMTGALTRSHFRALFEFVAGFSGQN